MEQTEISVLLELMGISPYTVPHIHSMPALTEMDPFVCSGIEIETSLIVHCRKFALESFQSLTIK